MQIKKLETNFDSELIFKTSRSAGPGGQSVNKVNTKVELRFNILNSALLDDEEKQILFRKLKNRISNDGFLIIYSQQSRSQLKNKKIVRERFYKLIYEALTPDPKRIPVKPPASLKKKRLEEKQKLSEKKALRKPPEAH